MNVTLLLEKWNLIRLHVLHVFMIFSRRKSVLFLRTEEASWYIDLKQELLDYDQSIGTVNKKSFIMPLTVTPPETMVHEQK